MYVMRLSIAVGLVTLLVGCQTQGPAADTGFRDVRDALFGRRHTRHIPQPVPEDSLLAVAREVTQIEDLIRRDGSITVKQPDVWGDSSLTRFIQEYDRLLEDSVGSFNPTIQAYIARSDQAELQSATSLASAVGEGVTTPTVDASTNLINLPDTPLFDLLGAAKGKVAPTVQGIGVEPTELERQRSTFINVNQALRRRNMGSDTTRAAGYALYKFRVPVSVLPGRETSRGQMAVVTMRAKLRVDEANLRYAFQKLVVADLVDRLAPRIHQDWGKNTAQDKECAAGGTQGAKPISHLVESTSQLAEPKGENHEKADQTPAAILALDSAYGTPRINVLRGVVQDHFEPLGHKESPPKILEIRAYLFSYLGQLYNAVRAQGLFVDYSPQVLMQAAKQVERGLGIGALTKLARNDPNYGDQWVKLTCNHFNLKTASISWLVAIQAGIVDLNVKKILEELYQQGKLSAEDYTLSQSDEIQFFNPDNAPEQTLDLWRKMIEGNFPIHTFALDPQVEEQNAYDAFSRRREIQLALAIGVAQRQFGMGQRLAASRQLALDMADIDLNRVATAFTHGNDTFGWYFRPRVQSPPPESSNIAAVARMIWSTGPTECYDLSHRKLEPGIRECELLVVMPSFVTQVDFDVTTNWESVARPGVTKRTYEEMIELGRRIQCARAQLGKVGDLACYRPGDYSRLTSRIDQLEKMLSLQTYTVQVPYEYEISGTDLFETGDVHLRPVLHDYYGLDYLAAGEGKAHVFLTGKNFHPTLTHVIVGGSESHSLSDNGVQVISREVLRVTIDGLNAALSRDNKFTVQVATPAGVSHALVIEAKVEPKSEPEGFKIEERETKWHATFDPSTPEFEISFNLSLPEKLTIVHDPASQPLLPNERGQIIARLTAKDSDGNVVKFLNNSGGAPYKDTEPIELHLECGGLRILVRERLEQQIISKLKQNPPMHAGKRFVLTATIYVKFDEWPVSELLNSISVEVEPLEKACDSKSGQGAMMAPAARVERFPLPQSVAGPPGPSGNLRFVPPAGR